jgi:FKBP-type peptidyl-prolyl cis-trans isomerase FkpA
MLYINNSYKNPVIAMIAILAMLFSCGLSSAPDKKPPDAEAMKEPLIRANIVAAQAEENQINGFIKRRGWQMQQTGSGLRYMIYHQGDGVKAQKGKVARISYTLHSIAGEIIYTSGESGPMEFFIGKGGVESGLEEAILLLHEGDKAKIIIPSHLGFGLAGDDHKIPPKATLIYDITVLSII